MPDGLNIDDKILELNLGKSFGSKPRFCFHSVRYDFKPASIDRSQKSRIQVGEGNSLSVSVPHIGGDESTIFKGNKRPTQKECILIIDNTTGEVTLEKLNSTLHLKKTRSEKPQSFLEKSQTPEKVNNKPISDKTPIPMQQMNSVSSMPQMNSNSSMPQMNSNSSMPHMNSNSSMPHINSNSSMPHMNSNSSMPQMNYNSSMPQMNSNSSMPQMNSNSSMPYRPIQKSAVKHPPNNNHDSSSCSDNSSSSSSDSSSEDEAGNRSSMSANTMVSMPLFTDTSPITGDNYNQNHANFDKMDNVNNGGGNSLGGYNNNMLSQDLCLSECSSSDED